MMTPKAPPIVFDDSGPVGFLDPDDLPGESGAGSATVHLEDGRRVVVPADALVLDREGRYRLAVALADIESLADEPREGVETVIPLVAEEVEIGKRTVERGKVRVKKGVTTREEEVAVPLMHEELDVVRVPMNRPVDGPVEVRREGDTWIVPVIEEVLVVEKRLVLKEELRITRRRVEETRVERVTLRAETAEVERDGPGRRDG